MNEAELLELGLEPCGAEYLTVNVRLRSCGRPVNHPYPHAPFATTADVEAAPYPDPLPEGAAEAAELGDRMHDESVWR